MVATTLSVGQMAIIGVNTEDNGNPQRDAITFILLRPVGSGTQIFFTDRAWNGTAFAASSAGENTFTFTASTDLAAGTVVTITQAQLTAAGINLADTGETVYAYQGAINAPTTFLHAVDLADGTIGFDGTELTNTGLVSGTSAVALNVDNAEMGTRSHNINALEYFRQVNNNTDWVQNDNSPQDGTQHSSGPGTNFTHALVAPDSMLIVAGSGAGEAIVTINLDSTYNSGTIGYQIVQAFQNLANLFHPSDITLDTVNDKYFFVDADLNGNNRLIQGSISDLLNNPGGIPTFTVLYSNTGTGATNSMRTLSIDTVNQKIYFDLAETFVRINYNTANQTPTVLADLGAVNSMPAYITQMTINYATGTVYLGSSSVTSVFGSDAIDANRVYVATGLTGFNAANSLTFTPINWGANGNQSVGPEPEGLMPLSNSDWPEERGTIRGVDVDPVTGLLWIVTGTVILDNGGDGFVTYRGGVWTYNPATGAVTNVYTQNGVTGPVGLLYYIEVDAVTGRYYVTDESGTNADPGDGGIWSGSMTGPFPATPTLVATVGNINGLGPQGLEIQHAPTLTGSAAGGLAVTEASSAPNSGETAKVTVFTGLSADDVDTLGGDELRGAVVRVSGNFVFEAASTAPGHTATVDFLRINNLTSGTIAGSGITFTYDQTTGMMVLSGVATTAEYAAAIALVQFSTSGDNVTNDGNALTRTIAASVFDGLLYSDEITATVTVTGINDAPVNTLGAPPTFNEDTTGTAGIPVPPPAPVNAITGLAISDADADATTEIFTVTLNVQHGVLNIRTDVVNGLAAGNVTGNGTATLILTGTQTQINTTLAATNNSAAANGLVYTPAANYNGADTLTMTTNDAGNNGNDPGVSGTGTTEQDSDTLALNITDVNDAPTVGGDGTEDSPAILEDTPFTNLNAPTVSTLFGGQFSDALDVQVSGGNPTGSTGDSFAGIAVVANGSNANGNWQYWDGDSWENIGAVSVDAARTYTAATLIRFNPTLNFNGAAPTLTVRLIESSASAVTNNAVVDLNPAPPITGPTAIYSAGSVTLSQTVTAVNDAPVNTVGGTTNATEDGGAVNVTGISIADVDANLATDVFTVTLDVDHGILNINTGVGGGVVAGDVSGNGTATITITATAAKINTTLAALGGLTYTPDADYNGADRVRVTTNDQGATGQDPGLTGDGTSEQDEDDKAINVAAVNDPVTGTAPATATLDEDATNVAIAGMSIADIDATLAPSGVYVVTLTATNGTMTLTTLTGLTFSAGDGTSDATMTFRGTLADLNTALATATYTPTANYNGSATITLQVTDTFGGIVATGTGAATNDSDVVNVTVNAVNDPVTTNAPATLGLDEDSVDTPVTGLSIADVDATLAPAGVYEVTLSTTQGALTLATLTGLTFTTGDGTSDATMTFHGTLADINTALATATYTPPADYNGPAQIDIQATDTFGGIVATGTGAATNDSDSIAVTVDSVNDAPSGADNNDTVVELATYTFDVADFSTGFADANDSPADTFASVVITTLPADGTIFFDDDAGGPNAPVAITAGDEFTAAQLAAGQLTYVAPAFATGPTDTFTFQVRDDGGTANLGVDLDPTPATFTFNITAANAAPTLDLDADDSNTVGTGYAGAYTEGGTAAAISDTDVDIADADAGDDIVSATITITNAEAGDKLNVGTLPGTVTVDISSTDTTVLLVAAPGTSAADFEAAIEAVTFSSTSDDPTDGGTNTSRSITVVVNDGADDSNIATATIAITGENDPPAGTDATITAIEDTHRVLTAADFGFTDPDSGDALGAVIITGVTGGKLFFDADGAGGADPVEVTVFPTGEYSEADLAAGKLTYLPNTNLNGSGVGTIGFQVVDNSGAGNDTDASANTLTVDVTPINDSPVVPNSPTISVDEQTTITINSSITVSDVDLDALNGGAGDYAGASFVINRDVSNADDLFNFDVTGALFTVNGNDLEAGGNVFATFTQSGGILNINFDSSETIATTALVNDVLRHLQYTNLSNDPPASVTLLYGLDDGAPDAVQGALGAPFNNFDGGQVVINLNAVNDAPVNSLGGTIGTGEDAIDAWLSGMSVSDPDADPATDDIDVTFDVNNGTLGIRTDVVGGIVAGDIISQTATTITVRATLNEINATLAASNGLTYSPDLNFNGDDTLTVTTNDRGFTGSDPGLTGDGTSEEDVDTRTISVSAVEDPADAVDDTNSVNEDALIVNASVLGNDSDPDGPPLTVTEVNGSTGDVGNEIILASGAKLTLRSDGTYDYNPNDQFNTLTDNTSGAVNTSDTDSFTYKLANGDTATVTITINGVVSDDDVFYGDATDNVITGTNTPDIFLMMDGGADTATGNGANDWIFYGASLDGTDVVNGGAGIDTLALQGDYTMTLGANQLGGIERLVLYSGTQGQPGTNFYDYAFTVTDAAVAAGTTLVVQGKNLVVGEQLIFNGVAETDGHFMLFGGDDGDILAGGNQSDIIAGGDGDDSLWGRAGNDHLTGGLGADFLRGGAGQDVFHYTDVGESTASSTDEIDAFQTIDHINLTAIDADGNAGNGDTAFTFIGSAAFSNTAGELRATESGGVWTVEGDVNGDGTADLVITINPVDPVPITAEDFFL